MGFGCPTDEGLQNSIMDEHILLLVGSLAGRENKMFRRLNSQ